jgi:ribosome-associated protein
MATTETRRMVLAAAQACENKKAEDTRILELDAMDAGFTDFFLISSGSNERQTQAIADEIEIRLKKDFQTYPNSVEGRRQGEWILMDYVDFVVHIFLTEKRAYYDIERLRKSARTVDLDQLKAMLVEKTTVARAKPAKKAAKKVVAKKTAAKASPKATVARRKPAVSKADKS